MPHNAIDTGYTIPVNTHVIQSPSWSPDSLNHSYGVELQQMVWHQEPASTKNSLRADGTRPPSSYWAKNVVYVNNVSHVQTGRTSPGWFAHDSSPAVRNMLGGSPSARDVIDFFVKPVGVNVENRAKTKFLTKLSEASGKGKWDLGVAAGELRETIHMVKDLANGLVAFPRRLADKVEQTPESILSWLRKAERMGVENALRHTAKKERGSLEVVTDAWLTYQLGLKPLAHDIFDGTVYLKAAMAEDDGSSFGVRVKAGAEETYKYSKLLVSEGYNGSPLNLYADLEQVVKIDYSCVYKVPVRASLREELGVDNPGALAWELVRYSWLADYALGVGSWLRSMTASNNTTFLEGTMSRKRVTQIVGLRSEPPPGAVIIKDPASKRMFLDIQLFEREVLHRGVMPAAMPGLKRGIGIDQLANALSVLKNFVR